MSQAAVQKYVAGGLPFGGRKENQPPENQVAESSTPSKVSPVSIETVVNGLGRAAMRKSRRLEELTCITLERLSGEKERGRMALQSLAIGEPELPLLHYLVAMGKSGLGSLRLLALSPFANRDQEDRDGVTALFRAVQLGNVDAARALA